MFQDKNSKSNRRNNNKSPLISQGHNANGLLITYFWYHGIRSNFCHNIKSCKHQKVGHKSNATYQNQMGGSTEHCKARNKSIRGSTTGSNNNTVKEIKVTLLQKHVLSAPPLINLKIDSGGTHHFQKLAARTYHNNQLPTIIQQQK